MDGYLPFMSFILWFVVSSFQVSMANDTIALSHSIIDRDATSLVSQNGKFEFGFFSPGNSRSRYLGIWYKNIPIQTVVWVANRVNPLNDSSGTLTINSTGNLILTQNGTIVWDTNPLKKPQANNPVVLQLMDSSNLVVREEKEANPENYLWQSFDYPTDTILPAMKLGWDFRSGLNRRLTDGFILIKGLKLPETTHTWVSENIGLDECRWLCVRNCSCMAYTNKDITRAGSGCVMWFGDLIDIKQFSSGGQDLYIRMAASELVINFNHEEAQPKQRKLTVIIAITISAIIGMLLLGCFFVFKVRRNMSGKSKNFGNPNDTNPVSDQDLPLLDLSIIASATNNFAIRNKIGGGGFGLVYKGRLQSGQEIAVKKLSRSSGQGISELKNEVKLIARVQHRNLVKLIGCCIERQEKILVYEYMTNNSLDSFIFDKVRGKLLDWSKRFHIIYGIARGLSYLHQDSRLRIIHRDLKASNILLDDEFISKISDFGMAKTFQGNQIEGNTNRVVGTYGYMAPEYAINGLFSIKSDVFSFGILLLEIICGKRNRGLYYGDYSLNLIGHAWILWKEGKAIELIDENLRESYNLLEVKRCIHVSLLCAQQYPEDRPTMPSVLLMLGSENNLPEPKQPGFFLRRDLDETFLSPQELFPSINELSITCFDGR